MPTKKPPKAKAAATKARIVKTKLKLTGKNTRVRAHLSTVTKRQQAKRDIKNG